MDIGRLLFWRKRAKDLAVMARIARKEAAVARNDADSNSRTAKKLSADLETAWAERDALRADLESIVRFDRQKLRGGRSYSISVEVCEGLIQNDPDAARALLLQSFQRSVGRLLKSFIKPPDPDRALLLGGPMSGDLVRIPEGRTPIPVVRFPHAWDDLETPVSPHTLAYDDFYYPTGLTHEGLRIYVHSSVKFSNPFSLLISEVNRLSGGRNL